MRRQKAHSAWVSDDPPRFRYASTVSPKLGTPARLAILPHCGDAVKLKPEGFSHAKRKGSLRRRRASLRLESCREKNLDPFAMAEMKSIFH